MDKYFLKDMLLWWPAWEKGVPFTSYGYNKSIGGDRYSFQIDKDCDVLLCPDGKHLPIDGLKLWDIDEGDVPFTSFSILTDGRVQINYRVDWSSGHHIEFYWLKDLMVIGAAYNPND